MCVCYGCKVVFQCGFFHGNFTKFVFRSTNHIVRMCSIAQDRIMPFCVFLRGSFTTLDEPALDELCVRYSDRFLFIFPKPFSILLLFVGYDYSLGAVQSREKKMTLAFFLPIERNKAIMKKIENENG